MEIKRPEPGEEPEQITLDVKDENSGTTISIDTVISPRKMTSIYVKIGIVACRILIFQEAIHNFKEKYIHCRKMYNFWEKMYAL